MVPGMTFADTLNLTWDPDYVLTTAPDGRREFSQVQFNLEVEQPTFGGSLSFVWTALKGNLDNVSGYMDPEGYGAGPYVHVNEYTNSYGTLENFANIEMKASVWGNLPWQLRGGWSGRSAPGTTTLRASASTGWRASGISWEPEPCRQAESPSSRTGTSFPIGPRRSTARS